MKIVFLVIVGLFALLQAPDATPEPEERQAGDTRTDEHGVEQVWVPAGCFMMGSTREDIQAILQESPPAWMRNEFPSEQPQHEVCITQGYWIDKTEVTNASYQAFIDAGGYTTQDYWSEDGWEWLGKQDASSLPDACVEETPDNHPRVCVTWYEVEAYAKWRGGSLPTEAQWEYAARGPESRIYPWGNEWDAAKANVVESTKLTPVDTYPDGASWVGALDMAGNAMEWVQDWLDTDYYDVSPKDDPTGPESGRQKVEKGGWWGSNPFAARAAYRHFEDPPTYQDHHIGFRIVSAEVVE